MLATIVAAPSPRAAVLMVTPKAVSAGYPETAIVPALKPPSAMYVSPLERSNRKRAKDLNRKAEKPGFQGHFKYTSPNIEILSRPFKIYLNEICAHPYINFLNGRIITRYY
jgi:hypothetical protein